MLSREYANNYVYIYIYTNLFFVLLVLCASRYNCVSYLILFRSEKHGNELCGSEWMKNKLPSSISFYHFSPRFLASIIVPLLAVVFTTSFNRSNPRTFWTFLFLISFLDVTPICSQKVATITGIEYFTSSSVLLCSSTDVSRTLPNYEKVRIVGTLSSSRRQCDDSLKW